MHRRLHRATAVLLLLPGIAAPNSGIIQVTGIHFVSRPDSTRITIDTSGPFEASSERAFNPDRIYFDLRRAHPWIEGHRYATRTVDDKLLKRIRVAETAPGTTRIVLDLSVQATFTVTRQTSPSRMVIELRAAPAPEVARPETVTRLTPPRPPPSVAASVSRGPLVYVAPSGPAARQVRRFVLPEPSVAHARTIAVAGNPPVLLPALLSPPRLPDPALEFAKLNPPKRALIVRSEPAAVIAPNPPSATADPVEANAVAASTKVIPALRPMPYDATPRASENASRSLTRALGLKVNRIVIDAGHGGHDDGTIGPNGVMEKNVVLDVATRLAKLVQTKMGAEVILTRSDDTFIPLQQRTAIANEYKADLFLSIHANSSPASSVAGTETFFLNFTNSPAALDVAARENAGSDKNVGELKDLIQSITLNDKITESETFAQQIQNSISAQAARSNAVAKNRGVKRAPFVVLIGASMPSVLAEIGFLSNARDESNLNKPEYRQKVAESLLRGLQQYSQSLSHFEVAAKK